MTLFTMLNVLGAIATVGMGLLGLIWPAACATLTGLHARNKTGYAEFRASFGGVFVVMGAFPLISGESLAYFMAGLLWLGAVAGRLTSIVIDKGYVEPRNFGALAVEGLFAFLLLAGSPSLLTLTGFAKFVIQV